MWLPSENGNREPQYVATYSPFQSLTCSRERRVLIWLGGKTKMARGILKKKIVIKMNSFDYNQ